MLVDHSLESHIWVVDPVHEELVIKQMIPAKQIVLVTGSPDIAEELYSTINLELTNEVRSFLHPCIHKRV